MREHGETALLDGYEFKSCPWLSQENSSVEEVCLNCNVVVGARGTLENHSIQCNGGPSHPSAPTERVVEFSHVEGLSKCFL